MEQVLQNNQTKIGTAKRFDNDKLRMDLIPASLNKEVSKILTFGANKYGDHNWRKGMNWSRCIGSLKRHLNAFEDGVDFDEESKQKHISHVIVNAMFILEYYSTFPQGDDRPHEYLKRPKIGLDIDDVLADWVPTWCEYHDNEIATSWQFDRYINDKFEQMRKDNTLDNFYLNLPVKIKPQDIPFEPNCYVTSRPVDKHISEQWLNNNGFPAAPVYSLNCGESKVETLKKAGVDIFVDDRFENFVELNNAGICTYLLDAPHNQRYNVGYKRLLSLKDLVK